MKKELDDVDHVLKEKAAWIDAKGFAFRVYETDEGVGVDIYKIGKEGDGPVASAYAFDSELVEEIEELP
jgi:hypothetical protein